MKHVHVIDSTLRDGEQSPGVSFSRSEKLEIARQLDQVGVAEIEAGIPVMGAAIQDDIRAIRSLNLRADISVWCRARSEDLDAAANCGVDKVHIALPSTDRLLATMDRDWGWLLQQSTAILAEARQRFAYVSCGLMDASRCPADRLIHLLELARYSEIDRVRLADTVGLWYPARIESLFGDLKQRFPDLPLGFHGHNDLGMATANALSAVLAGAEWVDVTVNGLGDRAGNVPLAEIVMALEHAVGKRTGINLPQLLPLSLYVANASSRVIPRDKPVVGGAIFHHEAGIHVKGQLRDRLSFQPYLPEEIGREPERMIAGSHSGRSARDFLRKTANGASEFCHS